MSMLQLHIGLQELNRTSKSDERRDAECFFKIGSKSFYVGETGTLQINSGYQHMLCFVGETGKNLYARLENFSHEATIFSKIMGESIKDFFKQGNILNAFRLEGVSIASSVPDAFRFPTHLPDIEVTVTNKASGTGYVVTSVVASDETEIMPNEPKIRKSEKNALKEAGKLCLHKLSEFQEKKFPSVKSDPIRKSKLTKELVVKYKAS
ncbi:hypothetical protein L2734_03155 [Parashewanella spongiae]|nr:hypothetical protein [Parashewanella spongiae]MCL1077183.1 hypothetical protein [Parashewanella spongiae]